MIKGIIIDLKIPKETKKIHKKPTFNEILREKIANIQENHKKIIKGD